jgi:hypothetical protein
MVKGLSPENFVKEFEPGSNPFEVTIVRLINPKAVDIRSMDKPLLMKLLSRIKMRAFSEQHRKAFENLIKAIDVKEQFCGIFTPDVSEIYFDGDIMIVDLTSYIKPGMESKIVRLFQVAMESPKVHEERIPHKELTDRAITDRFLHNVGEGMSIPDALKTALQQLENGIPVEPRPTVTPPPLPPPPPPPPQPMTRTVKTPPPTVVVSSDSVDTVIEDKIAIMERAQKEKEVACAEDEAAAKGRKPRKTVKRMKKKTAKETEMEARGETVGPPEEGPAPPTETEPPTLVRPEVDDMAQENSAKVDVVPIEVKNVEPAPEPVVERPAIIPPPPTISKGPDLDIKMAPTNGSAKDPGLGSLLSRLKGVNLDAPKDLPKEAPKVSDELKPVPPPPPKEEPKVEPLKVEEKPQERPALRIPPPPSLGEREIAPVKVTTEPDKPKPKTGESGLDELMKKLKGHSLK